MKQPFVLVWILAFSFSGCSDNPKPVKTWHLLPDGVTAAALSRNHALLASIDHGAEWWQLNPRKLRYTFRHGEGRQNLIAVSVTADGRRALTADREGIAWWDIQSGKPLASWGLAGIQAAEISPDGNWSLIGLRDRAIYFSLVHGKTRYVFSHDRPVKALSLDAKGAFALTGSDDGKAKLWDLENGRLRHTWEHRGKVASVALSPQGKYAMTNALLGPIQVWKTRSGKLQRKIGPGFITVIRAAFSPGGRFLATGHPSRGIKLWSVRSGRLLRNYEAVRTDSWRPTASPVLALIFIQNGRYLLSATSDGRVQKWRISGKKR